MSLHRSLLLFLWGIAKRVLLWAPALLLDPFDLWNRVARPVLPSRYQFDLPWSPDWAPYALLGLLGVAAFLTFHDMAKQVRQEPRPNMKFADVIARAVGSDEFWVKGNPERTLEAFHLVREKARLGHLHVWGRAKRFTQTRQKAAPLTPIDSRYWNHSQLNFHEFMRDERGESELENIHYNGGWDTFVDFMFDEPEVKREIKLVSPIERVRRWVSDRQAETKKRKRRPR